MAHIHLEDGALSPVWVIIWSLAAGGVIALILLAMGRGKTSPRKLALAAMCTSVGFAIFQVTIPVFGGIHLNLTPLIGILVGPVLGSISALLINVFSAAVGHGGWGLVGANTLVNIAEVVIAYYTYRFIRLNLKQDRFTSGLGAGITALTISALAIVAIVTISGLQDSDQTMEETFNNMLVIAAVNIAAGVLEGIVTGYIVSYVGRIRPDLLADTESQGAEEAPTSGA
jgi:cobalt/nickel transport system permease protein